MNRRNFIITGAGLAAHRAIAAQPPAACSADCCFPTVPFDKWSTDSARDLVPAANASPVRPLWSALCGQARKKVEGELKLAYGNIMRRKWTDKRGYMFQVWTHAWHCGDSSDTCQPDIHHNWAFLPWHRAFLYFHELLLRAELQHVNPNFRLPVWDWECDPKVPEIYQSLPSPSHGLYSCRRLHDCYSHVSQRDLNLWINHDFDAFCGKLNSPGASSMGIHQDVHTFLGGYMGNIHASVMDPLFFAHHANVDRFWDYWAVRHLQESIDNWPNVCIYLYNLGRMVRINVRDLQNTAQLGYSYEAPKLNLYVFETVRGNPDPDVGLVSLDADSAARLRALLLSEFHSLMQPQRLPIFGRDLALRLLRESSRLVAIQFRMTLPHLESGKFYLVGIQDLGSKAIYTLGRRAGFLAAHHGPTTAICADYLEPEQLYRTLEAILTSGIQLVYGPAADPASLNPVIAAGQAKPFTPGAFEFRIANGA